MHPEIYRAACLDLRPRTMSTAAAMITAACALVTIPVLSFRGADPDGGGGLTRFLLTAQLLTAGALVVQRAAGSFSRERTAGTWDLVRLTPRSAASLVAGRLGGSALLAGWCWLLFLPWAGYTATIAGFDNLGPYWPFYLAGLALVLLAGTLALLASTETRRAARGLFAVAGLLALAFLSPALRQRGSLAEPGAQLSYFGLSIAPLHFATLSMLVFAGWAFMATKWRIGRELHDRRNILRAPAFIIFLTAYAAGFTDNLADLTDTALMWFILAAPMLFACGAPLFAGEDREYWRCWLLEWRGVKRLHATPLWIVTWSTWALVSVAGIPAMLHTRAQTGILLVILAFAARDLIILQCVRLGRFRNPEGLAMFVIGMLYVTPAVLGNLTDGGGAEGLSRHFTPTVAAHPLAAAAQAAAAAAVLALILKRQLAALRSP